MLTCRGGPLRTFAHHETNRRTCLTPSAPSIYRNYITQYSSVGEESLLQMVG
ncbi:hypothetical protein GGQ68_004352 [Sagittula marina]|uniref:Uncharacterized protein n=1 Tax=Sagittula marina TaxID=943940 RepID=A0A7W6DRT2_9RHOB|nr:hypothetical protein [Sagittula marina]